MFKLVKSNYDKEDGVSFVEIQTDYGNLTCVRKKIKTI